jgi:urease accessory protein
MPTTKPSIPSEQLLLIWLSPTFPVGAYAYSHGLELAVARNLIVGRAGLEAWLRILLLQGSGRTDMLLLSAAWSAVTKHRFEELAEINALALALQPSAERYLETSQQGGSFVAAVEAAWPCAAMEALRSCCPEAVAYPVAVSAASAGHGMARMSVLRAFAMAFLQNLVSAAIRLSVIGQTDGQRVLAALMPDVETAAVLADRGGLDELGGAAFSSDLASLEHETLYTRVFRS